MLANIFLENNGVPVHEALIALTIVHVMLFLAWLGVDTGVFYTSWRLRKAGLSAETRLELTKVLVFLDRSPRMASLLMVPIALSLAFTGGLGLTGVSDAQMNAIFWPLIVLMLLMSWALVRFERAQAAGLTNTPFVRAYTWLLKLIKVGIFSAFMATGIMALVGVDGLWNNDYIAWKAILFACITAAGQWIEYGFRDFAASFGDLIANGETPERHQRFDRAVKGAYPPVLTLYALVAAAAILGMASVRGGF